jgi:hypothetical protein
MIVIAKFLQIEELIDEKDGAKKYQSFVNSYSYEREHDGTPVPFPYRSSQLQQFLSSSMPSNMDNFTV